MGKFPKKIVGYKINTIDIDEDELFESEEEARESIDIEETEMWECSVCGEKHEDKDEAYSCCD